MEEHSLYTHYLSRRKDEPERELSENTKKIIALVESEDFLELNKYWLSDIRTLWKIVYSARADVRYKLELLNGIMEEFKDTEEWDYKGKHFMEYYEPFRLAVDLMKSADNVFFTLTKVTRDENNSRSYYHNYPEFSSVDEISKYLESHFDKKKDNEDDPEWYIVYRHDNIKMSSYLLSKCGTVWKCGREEYYNYDIDEYIDYYEIEYVGNEISSGQFIAYYGDIIIFDRRPFYDICHMIYASDGGEEEGLYVEDGKLKTFPIEYHVTEFEEFAFELRVAVQEDMSKLSEQENILLLIQRKYRSLGEDDGYKFLKSIFDSYYSEDYYSMGGIPVEIVEEKFLK